MAGITLIATIYMISAFTRGNRTIMTTIASTYDLCMINCRRRYWDPGCRANNMTSITLIGSIDMIGTFTTGHGSIVTTDTGSDNVIVIDSTGRYWNPGGWEALVTGVTSIACCQMTARFTAGRNTIMTGNTIS